MKLSIVRPSHISGSSCKQGARRQLPDCLVEAHAHIADPLTSYARHVHQKSKAEQHQQQWLRRVSSSSTGPADSMAGHLLELHQHPVKQSKRACMALYDTLYDAAHQQRRNVWLEVQSSHAGQGNGVCA